MMFEINSIMVWGGKDVRKELKIFDFTGGKCSRMYLLLRRDKLELLEAFTSKRDKLVNEILHRSFPQSKTSK